MVSLHDVRLIPLLCFLVLLLHCLISSLFPLGKQTRKSNQKWKKQNVFSD